MGVLVHAALKYACCACRVVSATDLRKYDDPPGLQDNGEIIFNWLAGARATCRSAAPAQCHRGCDVVLQPSAAQHCKAQQSTQLCQLVGGCAHHAAVGRAQRSAPQHCRAQQSTQHLRLVGRYTHNVAVVSTQRSAVLQSAAFHSAVATPCSLLTVCCCPHVCGCSKERATQLVHQWEVV